MKVRRNPSRLLTAACAVAAACACASFAHAGVFNQQAGKGQVIVTSSFSTANESFAPSGRLLPSSYFRKFETTVLLEYGLTDWLQAIVKPSITDMSTNGPPGASYSGLGMTEAGLQARLWQFDSTVVAFQGTLRLPGSTNSGNPLLAGSTRTEEDLRLLVGQGFDLGSWKSFVDVQVGYRWRSAGPDQWRVDATIGTRPVPWLLFMLQSFNTVSQSANSAVAPALRQHKLQLSAVYDFSTSWSAQLGVFGNVAGRSVLAERGGLAAIWYRF
jgi:hypothetical protein